MVGSSRFTLSFSFAGIPTIIRPSIWIVLLILGSAGSGPPDLIDSLTFMLLGVLSLLTHEYGHAFCARAFGIRVLNVELGNLGGVTRTEERQNIPRWQNLIFVLAGAGAALVAAAIVGALLGLSVGDTSGGVISALLLPLSPLVPGGWDGIIPLIQPFYQGVSALDPSLHLLQGFSLFTSISVLWSIFNLLPILPLDGGKALVLLSGKARAASFIGMITSSLILVWALSQLMIFTSLIIAWLFYVNWSYYRNLPRES